MGANWSISFLSRSNIVNDSILPTQLGRLRRQLSDREKRARFGNLATPATTPPHEFLVTDKSCKHRCVQGIRKLDVFYCMVSYVVFCSVLQCVAVCCSVLQCVAVCCSVLQCVAVCCSVLQCCRYILLHGVICTFVCKHRCVYIYIYLYAYIFRTPYTPRGPQSGRWIGAECADCWRRKAAIYIFTDVYMYTHIFHTPGGPGSGGWIGAEYADFRRRGAAIYIYTYVHILTYISHTWRARQWPMDWGRVRRLLASRSSILSSVMP